MTHAAVAPYRLPPRIGMVDAVRRCLRSYAKFSGRAPRAEFWKFFLAVLLLLIASIVIRSLLWGPDVISDSVGANGQPIYTLRYHGGPVGAAIVLGGALPLLAVAWRRLHDTNVSGWWVFAPWLVLISAVLIPVAIMAGPTAMMNALTTGTRLRVIVSGHLMAILLLLIVSAHLFLVLRLTRPGDPGHNRFGPSPLEVTP